MRAPRQPKKETPRPQPRRAPPPPPPPRQKRTHSDAMNAAMEKCGRTGA